MVHRRSYIKFCNLLNTSPVPAQPITLARYVAYLSKRLKYSSLRQYLVIIGHMHKEVGLPNPLQDNYFLALALRGARRVLGDSVSRKEPITPQLLYHILSKLDVTTTRHAAVWAAALVMFFGLLRKSNVLPPSGAKFNQALHLRRRDITLTPTGVRITIRWSKTDQFRSRARVLPLPRIKGHLLCPTQAIFNALRLSPRAPPDGPAFTIGETPGAPPLSPALFSKTLLGALSGAGVDSKDFGTHSLRRGGASFLWSSTGVDEARIRDLGDWSSNASALYTISSVASLEKTLNDMASALPPP